MKKLSNVVMLPTEKASKLAFLTKKGEEVYKDLRYFDRPVKDHRDIDLTRPQHLYFTTDEDIKEGDWFIIINGHKNNNGIRKCYWIDGEGKLFIDPKMSEYWGFCKPNEVKKIVASTDESLRLPRPSNEFLKAYCEAYNSNPITEVNIEYVKLPVWHNRCPNGGTMITEIVGHTNTIKVAPDNTITISKVEEKLYTRDEVIEILYESWKDFWLDEYGHEDVNIELFNNWIKENLK